MLRKSHYEATEARQSSEVECKKLQKEVSRVKELREVSPPTPLLSPPLPSHPLPLPSPHYWLLCERTCAV